MKIILIEDEVQARESLKKILNLVNPETKVLFESGHIANSIEFLKANTVDLVFLDLHLEDGTGFDLLNTFPNRSFKVIITTAYDDKAVEAYRSNAADYLLKPINPYDLEDAIKRVKKQLKLEELTKKVEEPLTLKTTNSYIRILPSDIIRLEADGAYTRFITQKEDLLISKNLQYYQNMLGMCFLRVHQSHLVRQDQIQFVKGKELHLSNGDVVPVSIRKKQFVIESLQ